MRHNYTCRLLSLGHCKYFLHYLFSNEINRVLKNALDPTAIIEAK